MSLPTLETKLNGKSQRTTLYKNNSGLIAKMKVNKYKKRSVLNRKDSACKSATILIRDRCA